MNKKYQALSIVAGFLRIIGALTVIIGIGLSLWLLVESDRSQLWRIYAIGGIVGSVLVGVAVYGFGELISCVIDIEANTRANIKRSSIADKQREIARLQSEISEELKEGKGDNC